MRHKEWKMGTMVERIQHVGPSNLLNNMVKVFAECITILPAQRARFKVHMHAFQELRNKTQCNATQSKARESKGRKKAPECLLLEPGYESSRQGSSGAGLGELATSTSPLHSRGSPTRGTKSKLKTYAGGHHDAPRNKAWIQRLSRFPQ